MDNEARYLQQALASNGFSSALNDSLLMLAGRAWKAMPRHGDFQRWQGVIDGLPACQPDVIHLDQSVIHVGHAGQLSVNERETLMTALQQLHPWRKGPFSLFGIEIDTEWRSDWKWQRLQNHITPLHGRCVLDIGCGSGYHLWRMRGAGAALAIGIDPTVLFAMQFRVFKHYAQSQPVFHLPLGIESMPATCRCFDTVFSMGILYHRRSPVDHLLQLRELLRPGGELVLETLYIEGDDRQCLLPAGRYAKMRNVWFIPSLGMLECMLARTGFRHIRLVDASPTSTDEQRSTNWMRFESLADFLAPDDTGKTIEGYPAPRRAVFIASNPLT